MSWESFFKQDDIKSLMHLVDRFLKKEEAKYGDELLILPPPSMRFAAFDLCPFDDVKVCIWGQDPYSNRGEAHGLCFSVDPSVKTPPSLRNILKELKDDLGIERTNTDLTSWAKQGVLLLNSSLTVLEHSPNSHAKHWKPLTDRVIEYISENKTGVVFILWGALAKSKEKLIDTSKHHVLKANHPSPLSANRGGFFGCKHFSKTNALLKQPINW